MDPAEYKDICARPDVVPRPVIEDTVRTLHVAGAPEADDVEDVLDAPPVEKPPIHIAGPESDFFWVGLDCDGIDAVLDVLLRVEAEAAAGPRDALEARRLAELIDVWGRCRDWLDDGGAA